jgi:dienelactone hydrolase
VQLAEQAGDNAPQRATDPTPERRRGYLVRLLRLTLVALLVPLIVLPLLIGAVPMWILVHPGCGPDSATPADNGLKYQNIHINGASGTTYNAFFIPGTKDGLIIVPPAYGGGRGGMLYEGALLVQGGYNVLTYEAGLCMKTGRHSLGYLEVEEIADVLDYLKRNPDNLPFNPARIALHGFSSAGATSIMAAARFPEIHAVLAEGGYHNIEAYLGLGNARNPLEAMMIWGARTTYRLAIGYDASMLDPYSAARQIPPRPIYFVYGSQEVSLAGARASLEAIRTAQPGAFADLWVVEGATHGSYTFTAGVEEYKRHVLPFYDCALMNECDAWRALPHN